MEKTRQAKPAAFAEKCLGMPLCRVALLARGSGNNRHEEQLTEREAAALRLAAALYYITDQNQCTVRDMRALREFSAVSMRTLNRWCDHDRWIERRHANLTRWRRMVEDRIGAELVRQRTGELQRLEKLLDAGVKKAAAKGRGRRRMATAKSWESVAAAVCKIAACALEIRRGMMNEFRGPAAADEKSQQPTPPALTPDEARLLGEALLAGRSNGASTGSI